MVLRNASVPINLHIPWCCHALRRNHTRTFNIPHLASRPANLMTLNLTCSLSAEYWAIFPRWGIRPESNREKKLERKKNRDIHTNNGVSSFWSQCTNGPHRRSVLWWQTRMMWTITWNEWTNSVDFIKNNKRIKTLIVVASVSCVSRHNEKNHRHVRDICLHAVEECNICNYNMNIPKTASNPQRRLLCDCSQCSHLHRYWKKMPVRLDEQKNNNPCTCSVRYSNVP